MKMILLVQILHKFITKYNRDKFKGASSWWNELFYFKIEEPSFKENVVHIHRCCFCFYFRVNCMNEF